MINFIYHPFYVCISIYVASWVVHPLGIPCTPVDQFVVLGFLTNVPEAATSRTQYDVFIKLYLDSKHLIYRNDVQPLNIYT